MRSLELGLDVVNYIAKLSRLFELQVGGGEVHLAAQILDEVFVFVLGDFLEIELGGLGLLW